MYVYSPTLFFVLQLLGLLPVTADSLPLRGDVLRFSRARILYSLLLAVAIFVIFVGWVWESFFSEYAETSGFWSGLYSTTAIVSGMTSAVSTSLAALLCLVVSSSRVQKKIQLLEKIREIDFQLQRKGPGHNTRIVSYLAIAFICTVYLSENYISHDITFDSVSQVFKVLVMCGLVEWMELVLSVKDRFQQVNERLMELVARKCSKQLLWTVGQLPCIETFNMPQEMTLSISTLSEAHWALCCVVYDIIDTYGSQMAVTMMFIFSHLVYHPLQLFMLYTFVPFPRNVVVLTLDTLWILVVIIELFILVKPCSLAVTEAKKTVAVVTKLMENKMEKRLFKELESFAHQLFYRDVEFSAGGLFTLQTPIIISVATAVTTYMAIIIQFQTSSSDLASTTSTSLAHDTTAITTSTQS